MPKQVNEIKSFIVTANRKDAKSVRIKKNGSQYKFKVRCSKYLYTLVIADGEKANKLKQSLPTGLDIKDLARNENDDEPNPLDEQLEKKDFYEYNNHSKLVNEKRRKDYESLNKNQKKLLLTYKKKIDTVDHCINKNSHFLSEIVYDEYVPAVHQEVATSKNIDKVRSTLRQFVREWSSEGEKEREDCYLPILNALDDIYKDISIDERYILNILLPGAGLGRLPYEVTKKGFSCEGNEFSFHMLFGSNYVLNKTKLPDSVQIFPWVHSFSHCFTADLILKPVFIPDEVPKLINENINFSMTAGEFAEVYSKKDQLLKWDCIITNFFIDTAHNVLDYMEVIHGALKPNGIWINLGPLLYHFEGSSSLSIELSFEELREVINSMGFEITSEKLLTSTYSANKDSLMNYVYNNIFFIASKKNGVVQPR
ncbi:hypothetical protein HK099_007668 [Clydaea vesicula]|uniref:carnosine N-methyltransferase n=1 Tax=Clydaea vesicula TaxID=447962 RepID=A0AAD5TZT3_9FUNG|nr:hypothetical protein HK099_007668 [Clydaea vesicula]